MRRIFSAHEHLGYGKLSFSNGTAAIYDASPETLKADLRLLGDAVAAALEGKQLQPVLLGRKE